jgi:hypothetical protein
VWLTAFIDLPADRFEEQVAFWQGVTGLGLSSRRGDAGQFATLVPDDSDAWLRVQRLDAGEPRIHLDLHADDPVGLRDRATGLGATVVDESDVIVMTSPGGLEFCAVTGAESRTPRPRRWDGHRSLTDQVCLDFPETMFDDEAHFWAQLLDRELRPSPGYDEFARLVRQPGDPIRILLQRVGDGPARAHLDLATDNRDAEVDRIRGLGATQVRRTDGWTTLRDPAGMEFCVTDRDPEPEAS